MPSRFFGIFPEAKASIFSAAYGVHRKSLHFPFWVIRSGALFGASGALLGAAARVAGFEFARLIKVTFFFGRLFLYWAFWKVSNGCVIVSGILSFNGFKWSCFMEPALSIVTLVLRKCATDNLRGYYWDY